MSMKIESGSAFRYVPPSVSEKVAGGPLGNTARNVSVQRNQDFQDFRKKKFEARSVAHKHNPKDKKFRRIQNCGTKPIWGKMIEVKISAENHGFYSGIETCGNVWACPVCSPKIQARRGQEIGQVVEKAYAEGYKVSLITFTHPHYKGQRLAKLIDMQNRALRLFRQGRFFQDWKEDYGYFGTITAAEVTCGRNGWHWHHHALFITKSDGWDDSIFKLRWINCLKKVGFDITDNNWADVYVHGLDIMRNCHSKDYLTKMGLKGWGVENEVRGGSGKDSMGGKSPFELLRVEDWDSWQEYVRATRGRKQLVWSKGLKAWAFVEELTDEEIASKEEQEQVKKIAVVPEVVWWQLVRRGLRLELLESLENGGREGLQEWCVQKGIDLHFPSPPPPKWADFGGEVVYEVIA